jgi:hypothetical protein
VDNALGILVWTTLIVGSATVLFLALPDFFFWIFRVREKMQGSGRGGISEGLVAPTIAHDASQPIAKKRARRRRV